MLKSSHPHVRFRTIVLCAAAAGVMLSCTLPASAQRRRQQPVVVKVKTYRMEGSIVGVRPGLIQCADEKGKPYLIKLDRERTKRVVVSGTAEPGFLRAGLFVRFTALLDKRGKPTEPVAEMTIFDPRDGFTMGVFPDDPTDPNGPYLVAGQIREMKRGKVTLAAGNRKVQFELAESPQIGVEVSDYSLARRGDSIQVTGIGRPERPQELIGTIVEIKLSQPLSGPQKKTRGRKERPPRRSRRGSTERPVEKAETP